MNYKVLLKNCYRSYIFVLIIPNARISSCRSCFEQLLHLLLHCFTVFLLFLLLLLSSNENGDFSLGVSSRSKLIKMMEQLWFKVLISQLAVKLNYFVHFVFELRNILPVTASLVSCNHWDKLYKQNATVKKKMR